MMRFGGNTLPGLGLPTFSLWSTEGPVEGQVVGGIDEFTALVQRNREQSAAT
jgi:hypothetical protein